MVISVTTLGFIIDDSFQTQVLEVARSANNYRRWLSGLTLPFLGENPLELGSGLGDYAVEWLNMGASRITLSESSPTRLASLVQLSKRDSRIRIRTLNADDPNQLWGGDYSCVISLNVLEHLKDDAAAVRSAHQALRPGGTFVAFVPAHAILWSKFDVLVGHHRRYSRDRLRRIVLNAGFEIRKIHYVNLAGWFAWLFGMRLLGLSPKDGPLLAAWDRLVIPAVMRIEKLFKPPFGQSLLVVGIKVSE